MTHTQFRAALDKLGLTQLAAARHLRVAGRTVRRWALAEVPVPPLVVIVLELLLAGKITIEDVIFASRENRC